MLASSSFDADQGASVPSYTTHRIEPQSTDRATATEKIASHARSAAWPVVTQTSAHAEDSSARRKGFDLASGSSQIVTSS